MTIQEKLQRLSEDNLRIQIVVPLMEALGCVTVRNEHGASEFGKDVVYCAENIYRRSYHGAIVLKAERIRQDDVVGTVQRQVQEACTVPYTAPPDLTTPVRMTEVTVMTSFDITPNARTVLQAAMASAQMARVHFVDGDELAALIRGVVKRAIDHVPPLAQSDYEFDAANFHEICERVTQNSGHKPVTGTDATTTTEGETAQSL